MIPYSEIQRAAGKIAQNLRVDKIILFGSYAYGKPGPDSDVDLLIIMRSRQRPALRRLAVSNALGGHPFPMDVVVLTPREIKTRLAGFDPFLEDALSLGKVLYDA